MTLPAIPGDREGVWNSIRDAYRRHAQPDSSLAIVCLTGDRELATDVGHEFAARFDSIGIETRVVLWADEMRWADLETGDIGRPQIEPEGCYGAELNCSRAPPGNRSERLVDDVAGQHSIRINDQYRSCLVCTHEGADDVGIPPALLPDQATGGGRCPASGRCGRGRSRFSQFAQAEPPLSASSVRAS